MSYRYKKAQGQTLKKVLLDNSTISPFAHGYLYVALSRVKNYAIIRIFCFDHQIIDSLPIVSNVVYPEILPTNLSIKN